MADFEVVAAGPEHDSTIVANWKNQWRANGRSESMLTQDQSERMLEYVAEAREKLQHHSFVALSDGKVIGSASCQLWSGPMPDVALDRKTGTCWGVFVDPEWRRRGVGTQLMRSIIECWRCLGCTKGVLLCASEEARRVYSRLGFGAGHMMLLDLDRYDAVNKAAECACSIEAAGEEADAQVAQHWRAVWSDAGVLAKDLAPDLESRIGAFINSARQRLEYQAFLAREPDLYRVQLQAGFAKNTPLHDAFPSFRYRHSVIP